MQESESSPAGYELYKIQSRSRQNLPRYAFCIHLPPE
jgi:hypothetical protein